MPYGKQVMQTTLFINLCASFHRIKGHILPQIQVMSRAFGYLWRAISKPCRAMLANSGELTPPCGVPIKIMRGIYSSAHYSFHRYSVLSYGPTEKGDHVSHPSIDGQRLTTL